MAAENFLHKYFLNNGGKRLHKWVHYFDIYERHFERFRDRNAVMIEIGVHGGGSLEMWKAYLGEGATIIGIDINPACKRHERIDDKIHVYIGSQDDAALIDKINADHPRIDILLDDGSHVMSHMIDSFNLLYHRISEKGVYLVEDTHTCYWPKYGGGLNRADTFMEFTKHKLDEINAVHTRGALPVSDFTRSTASITCYDSIVVFEKRPQGQRQAPITSAMP